MNRLKAWRIRGDWSPARLTYADLWALVSILIVQALLRGFDYATGPRTVGSLGLVEQAAPLWVWSMAMFIGAGLLLIGALARRHFLVWLGHGVLWVAYLAIFVGLAAVLINRPYLDGIRFVAPLATVLALHFILWLRTGPRPLHQCDSESVEAIEVIAGPGHE